MKHVIGIDAGTNSAGWTLTKEYDNERIDLIDIGTYIFPIGTNVDDQSNVETTKNEQRRVYRGTKRNLMRYKLRRKKLKSFLNNLGMLPDFTKLYKQKGRYQSIDLYELRSKAILEQLPLEEIGRIFLLLNKYRGFASNANKKTIIEEEKLSKETKEEDKKVKAGIDQLSDFISKTKAQTIGEYFYLMHKKAKELFRQDKWHNPNELIDERAIDENGKTILFNSRGIRKQFGRYTAREMYQMEFDLIWETQKQFYDKTHPNIFTGSPKEYAEIKQLWCEEKNQKLKTFKTTNYWLIRNYSIYYQRPLRSQHKYVANCQFENNKKVIPTSSPIYQEFRIWKNIADLRYTCEKANIFNQELPLEWKNIIADYLQVHEKVYISKPYKKKVNNNTYIVDLLPNTDTPIIIKSEDEEGEKYIKGNLTYLAFFKSLGEKKFSELKKEDKLEKLWHHIYMAKDDEWIKDKLLCQWNFDEEIANKLIEFGLEEEHGSYSAKVIGKILPHMKDGKDEYTSLVLSGYLKSSDEVKEDVILKNKITQLKYQELRNPVVEKSVSQVIKIINAILEKYKDEIDQNNLEIRIESTRELKKPRKERENMLREIREKDKIRQEYADFLNKKKEINELNFSRRIEKYDGIINKFELWLEMGMDKDDPNFIEFESIVKKGDKEKHLLWLECNRICPYSGNTISLSKLFSPEIELEHIIPLSRSLDDSFNNKTITFSSINKEKGNRTAFEYMKWKNQIGDFQKRIKDATNNFSKSKKEQFLRQDIKEGFTHNQLSNTSYIAKYVRKKMFEICRTVQFTNGAATAELRRNDWKLSDLLDKIRFEEETGTDDIDIYINNYRLYRKEIIRWLQKKEKSTDINIKTIPEGAITEFDIETGNNLSSCIEKVKQFEAFKNKSGGKKDRSDHRHHAIDALITACCSPSVTKYLSTFNRFREEKGIPLYNEYGNLSRKLLERPFDYNQLKQKVKEILVCHNVNQKLIIARKNKHKTSNGIKEQRTYAPQGSLHKDGLYGKLKEPFRQGFDKKDVFVKRVALFDSNRQEGIDINKVVDNNIKEILTRRIEKYGDYKKAFSKETMETDPLYMYSIKKYPEGYTSSKKGKPLPVIKNVRIINKNSRNLIQLPAKNEHKEIVSNKRYAEVEGNYMMVLYELKEKNKKEQEKNVRDFILLSFFEAVRKKRNGEKLFNDIIERNGKYLSPMKDCNWLKQGDIIALYESNEIKRNILQQDLEIIIPRLYKVVELNRQVNVKKGTDNENEYGVIKLAHINKLKTNKDSYTNKGYFIKVLHTGINAIKIRLNILGKIESIGEECF